MPVPGYWSAARMASKNFGDRMQVEHSAQSSYVDALKGVNEKQAEYDGGTTPQELRARDNQKISVH